jgi:hypothetical protein
LIVAQLVNFAGGSDQVLCILAARRDVRAAKSKQKSECPIVRKLYERSGRAKKGPRSTDAQYKEIVLLGTEGIETVTEPGGGLAAGCGVPPGVLARGGEGRTVIIRPRPAPVGAILGDMTIGS